MSGLPFPQPDGSRGHLELERPGGVLTRRKLVLPALFFGVTLLTTLYCGYDYHLQFTAKTPEEANAAFENVLADPSLLFLGAPFSLTLLLILFAHEMGHYLACRIHRVEATLPFFIPAPPIMALPPPLGWLFSLPFGESFPFFEWLPFRFNPFGTFGAIIRIRSMFENRRQLFDVGIAGPLAGFIFIVPALAAGLSLSKAFVPFNPEGVFLVFGEPLAFDWASRLFFPGPEGAEILLHPVGWAAWFGLLATSINLLPFGQLDGGHVVYAIFGPRVHVWVSRATLAGLIILSLASWPSMGYLAFAVILLAMGFRHPPAMEELSPVTRGRLAIALLGLIIFILSFIPFPIQIVESTARAKFEARSSRLEIVLRPTDLQTYGPRDHTPAAPWDRGTVGPWDQNPS